MEGVSVSRYEDNGLSSSLARVREPTKSGEMMPTDMGTVGIDERTRPTDSMRGER